MISRGLWCMIWGVLIALLMAQVVGATPATRVMDSSGDPVRTLYQWRHPNCDENKEKPVYDPDQDGNPDPHYHPVASVSDIACMGTQCTTTFQSDELVTISGYKIPGCRLALEEVVVDFHVENLVRRDCDGDGTQECLTGHWTKVAATPLPPVFYTCPKGTPCCP